MAAGTPAGTEITNRASATYIDPSDPLGKVQTIPSNELVTTVDPVYLFEITPNGTAPSAPGQTQTALPDGLVVFTYTITNLGNISDTIALVPGQDTSDAYNLEGLKFYLDNNDNGIFDPAVDPEISSLELDRDVPGTTIFAVGTVPLSAVPGTSANINVTGTSQNGAQPDDDNWARVTVEGTAPIFGANIGNGNKNPAGPPSETPVNFTTPGTPVSYPLELTNTGNTPDAFGLTIPGLPSGWTADVFADNNCDGVADSDTPIPVTEQLAADENVCLVVTVTPPAGAPSGTTPVTVTATSETDPTKRDSITNTVTVEAVTPPVAGVDIGNSDGNTTTNPDGGNVTETASGAPVSFPLELKNTGTAPDRFDLFLNLPSGWTGDIFPDDNCDGEADSTTPLANTGLLEPGENVCFVLVVTPPADAPAGSTTFTVTASSRTDPDVQDTITNTVVVTDDGGGETVGVNLGNGDRDDGTAPVDSNLDLPVTPGTPRSYPLELDRKSVV